MTSDAQPQLSSDMQIGFLHYELCVLGGWVYSWLETW